MFYGPNVKAFLFFFPVITIVLNPRASETEFSICWLLLKQLLSSVTCNNSTSQNPKFQLEYRSFITERDKKQTNHGIRVLISCSSFNRICQFLHQLGNPDVTQIPSNPVSEKKLINFLPHRDGNEKLTAAVAVEQVLVLVLVGVSSLVLVVVPGTAASSSVVDCKTVKRQRLH